MLRIGHVESCHRFIRWVNNVIVRQRETVEKLSIWQEHHPGAIPPEHLILPTRYTMNGAVGEDEDWPNFQIDGYGTWLWLVSEYVNAVNDRTVLQECREGISLTITYLSGLWQLPNYDCWEEYSDRIHLSTLACVGGGLQKISGFSEFASAGSLAKEITAFIYSQIADDGYFPKNVGSHQVDSSLLWLSLPFDMVPEDSPEMRKTVQVIEESLLSGGLKRYSTDTYYGGGRWVLLSAWLGWYYCRTGRRESARSILDWIISTAGPEGDLPEQVPEQVTDPYFIRRWQKLWGDSAIPLLWSHAMYIVFIKEFEVSFKEELV